jgi:hypothetical protein
VGQWQNKEKGGPMATKLGERGINGRIRKKGDDNNKTRREG